MSYPVPRREKITSDDKPWLDMYSRDMGTRPEFDRKEERHLLRKIKNGDKSAADLCARSLLPLVLKLAVEAKHKYHWVKLRVRLIDLIGAGNVGLVMAMKKFKPGKNTRLSTYATFWIRRYIQKEIEDYRFIRVPDTTGAQIGKINKASFAFKVKNGFDPGLGDLAKSLKRPIRRVGQVFGAMAEVKNETEAFADVEFTLDNQVFKEKFLSPEDAAQNSSLREKLLSALRSLPLREREVLKRVFGIDCPACSLSEIGRAFGITAEAVRQTKEKGLKRLLCQVDLTKCL